MSGCEPHNPRNTTTVRQEAHDKRTEYSSDEGSLVAGYPREREEPRDVRGSRHRDRSPSCHDTAVEISKAGCPRLRGDPHETLRALAGGLPNTGQQGRGWLL